MTVQPKRHCCCFNLRTLSVLFAMVCVPLTWFAHQWQIVRERGSLLYELQHIADSERHIFTRQLLGHDPDVVRTLPYTDISNSRKLLGDEAYVAICVPSAMSADWYFRLEKAFPEASLHVLDYSKTDRGVNDGTGHAKCEVAFRDSLYAPTHLQRTNVGTIFTTGCFKQ